MLYKMRGRKYVSSNHFYFTASSVKVTNFPANAISGEGYRCPSDLRKFGSLLVARASSDTVLYIQLHNLHVLQLLGVRYISRGVNPVRYESNKFLPTLSFIPQASILILTQVLCSI